MTRLAAVFWLALVVVAGFTTFTVKYAVQNIEDQLNRVRKQTIAEQQEIRVLNAEWTYLNQPDRLAELNRRFLALVPTTARQLQRTIADIPLRAPDVAPDVLLAATPESAAPLALDDGPTVTPAALTIVPPSPAPSSPAAPSPAAPSLVQPSAEGRRTGPVVLVGRPGDAAPAHLAKAAPSQLGKADRVATPSSLDALIAQIADAR